VQSRTHVHTVQTSERFTWPDQLKIHLLKSHNEGTWSTCNICQKKFIYGAQLKRHLMQHNILKTYACSVCPKSFCSPSALRYHQLVHSDYRQFCCGLCGKDFKRKHNVVSHFKMCSGEPTILKPYACSVCPKSFCFSSQLKSHQLIHSDYKQFCCGLCDKDFKCKTSVVEHFKMCADKLGYSKL